MTGLNQPTLPSDGLLRLDLGTRDAQVLGGGGLVDLNFSVLFLLLLDLEDRWTAGLDWVSHEDLT